MVVEAAGSGAAALEATTQGLPQALPGLIRASGHPSGMSLLQSSAPQSASGEASMLLQAGQPGQQGATGRGALADAPAQQQPQQNVFRLVVAGGNGAQIPQHFKLQTAGPTIGAASAAAGTPITTALLSASSGASAVNAASSMRQAPGVGVVTAAPIAPRPAPALTMQDLQFSRGLLGQFGSSRRPHQEEGAASQGAASSLGLNSILMDMKRQQEQHNMAQQQQQQQREQQAALREQQYQKEHKQALFLQQQREQQQWQQAATLRMLQDVNAKAKAAAAAAVVTAVSQPQGVSQSEGVRQQHPAPQQQQLAAARPVITAAGSSLEQQGSRQQQQQQQVHMGPGARIIRSGSGVGLAAEMGHASDAAGSDLKGRSSGGPRPQGEAASPAPSSLAPSTSPDLAPAGTVAGPAAQEQAPGGAAGSVQVMRRETLGGELSFVDGRPLMRKLSNEAGSIVVRRPSDTPLMDTMRLDPIRPAAGAAPLLLQHTARNLGEPAPAGLAAGQTRVINAPVRALNLGGQLSILEGAHREGLTAQAGPGGITLISVPANQLSQYTGAGGFNVGSMEAARQLPEDMYMRLAPMQYSVVLPQQFGGAANVEGGTILGMPISSYQLFGTGGVTTIVQDPQSQGQVVHMQRLSDGTGRVTTQQPPARVVEVEEQRNVKRTYQDLQDDGYEQKLKHKQGQGQGRGGEQEGAQASRRRRQQPGGAWDRSPPAKRRSLETQEDVAGGEDRPPVKRSPGSGAAPGGPGAVEDEEEAADALLGIWRAQKKSNQGATGAGAADPDSVQLARREQQDIDMQYEEGEEDEDMEGMEEGWRSGDLRSPSGMTSPRGSNLGSPVPRSRPRKPLRVGMPGSPPAAGGSSARRPVMRSRGRGGTRPVRPPVRPANWVGMPGGAPGPEEGLEGGGGSDGENQPVGRNWRSKPAEEEEDAPLRLAKNTISRSAVRAVFGEHTRFPVQCDLRLEINGQMRSEIWHDCEFRQSSDGMSVYLAGFPHSLVRGMLDLGLRRLAPDDPNSSGTSKMTIVRMLATVPASGAPGSASGAAGATNAAAAGNGAQAASKAAAGSAARSRSRPTRPARRDFTAFSDLRREGAYTEEDYMAMDEAYGGEGRGSARASRGRRPRPSVGYDDGRGGLYRRGSGGEAGSVSEEMEGAEDGDDMDMAEAEGEGMGEEYDAAMVPEGAEPAAAGRRVTQQQARQQQEQDMREALLQRLYQKVLRPAGPEQAEAGGASAAAAAAAGSNVIHIKQEQEDSVRMPAPPSRQGSGGDCRGDGSLMKLGSGSAPEGPAERVEGLDNTRTPEASGKEPVPRRRSSSGTEAGPMDPATGQAVAVGRQGSLLPPPPAGVRKLEGGRPVPVKVGSSTGLSPMAPVTPAVWGAVGPAPGAAGAAAAMPLLAGRNSAAAANSLGQVASHVRAAKLAEEVSALNPEELRVFWEKLRSCWPAPEELAPAAVNPADSAVLDPMIPGLPEVFAPAATAAEVPREAPVAVAAGSPPELQQQRDQAAAAAAAAAARDVAADKAIPVSHVEVQQGGETSTMQVPASGAAAAAPEAAPLPAV